MMMTIFPPLIVHFFQDHISTDGTDETPLSSRPEGGAHEGNHEESFHAWCYNQTPYQLFFVKLNLSPSLIASKNLLSHDSKAFGQDPKRSIGAQGTNSFSMINHQIGNI